MTALAQLHVARKQLGLDEDTYRDALERATGKRSAGDMSEAERKQAIQYFKGKGFVPAPGRKRQKLAGQYAPKLQALWIAGWNLGLMRDRSDKAMLAFVKRQTQIDHTRFLRDGEDAMKAIEALKGWLARAGVDWTASKFDPVHAACAGCKIAEAQVRMLPEYERMTLARAVALHDGTDIWELTHEQMWHPVMNAFGAKIRARQGGAQ